MLGMLAKFNHKAEMRESKDEMMVGELVRAMARQGYPAVQFWANNDFQRVKFRAVSDSILSAVYVTVDRKSGTGALSAALVGSKATMTITAEVKNYLADPDDLVAMYKTDLQNLFKLPVMGGIRLNHELNSVFATTAVIVDIDQYVMKGPQGTQGLIQWLGGTIGQLREKLGPYKKG